MIATAEDQQQMWARSLETRQARAKLKERIARGEVSAASIVREPPSEARGWPVFNVIVSQLTWSRERTLRMLECARVQGLKPVGQLTGSQRKRITELLEREWR